jgi:hypothetical protein
VRGHCGATPARAFYTCSCGHLFGVLLLLTSPNTHAAKTFLPRLPGKCVSAGVAFHARLECTRSHHLGARPLSESETFFVKSNRKRGQSANEPIAHCQQCYFSKHPSPTKNKKRSDSARLLRNSLSNPLQQAAPAKTTPLTPIGA